MQDGYTQMGAGPSDNRLAGRDLQHNRQTRTADENPTGMQRVVTHAAGMGGPMKHALDGEMQRHKEAKTMRMKHMEDHYKR